MQKDFTQKLFRWYSLNKRNLPWLGSNNPYLVWLSEVILQQTRVEQGLDYFLKFKKKYPTIKKLANAEPDEVMKMWEGLGYYSRARNMHSTAKTIDNELNGVFPSAYDELLKLKGIGTYTAHAILSYAYKQPYAVVDGNVLRIFSRFYGINEAVDTPNGKNIIQAKANLLLDKNAPDIFNQALMDFGSLVCKPKNPDCINCPFNNKCVAFKEDQTAYYPIKSKKIKQKVRYFHFFLITDTRNLLLTQRTDKDIWKNLYQFPVITTENPARLTEVMNHPDFKALNLNNNMRIIESTMYKQQLTHQKLLCRFYIFEVNDLEKIELPDTFIIDFKQLKKYAFPGVIRDFLKNNEYF
jgi:A/G-specific adenine glycosylase